MLRLPEETDGVAGFLSHQDQLDDLCLKLSDMSSVRVGRMGGKRCPSTNVSENGDGQPMGDVSNIVV